MSPVAEKASRLRQVVNQEPRLTRFSSSGADWLRMTSALDVLGDTEQAISAFPIGEDVPLGSRYLLLYGLFQAFVLQQDAADSFARAIGASPTHTDYPALSEIRRMRNAATGHPTDIRRGTEFGYVIQHSLTTKAFELWTINHRGTPTLTYHDLGGLITAQQAAMSRFIDDLISATRAIAIDD